MSKAKPILLTGRTEIIAAIYNPAYLPSAVLCGRDPSVHSDPHPNCVHAIRNDDLSFFDDEINRFKEAQKLEKTKETDDDVQAWLYPFCEDFPHQGLTCHACYYSDKTQQNHEMRENKEICTKSTEACA